MENYQKLNYQIKIQVYQYFYGFVILNVILDNYTFDIKNE
jgi:hypothetical protein